MIKIFKNIIHKVVIALGLLLTFLIPFKIQAQNLITDSSFEKWEKVNMIPYSDCDIQNSIEKWYCVNKGTNTPDFIKYKPNLTKYDCLLGNHKPRTGDAYVHICFSKKNAECIESELVHTLKKNTFYKVKLYVVRTERSIENYIKQIPIYMMYEKYDPNKNYQHIKPMEINGEDTSGLKDYNNWIECTGIYKAQGGEKWLMVGAYKMSYYSNNKEFKEPLNKKQKKQVRYSNDDLASYMIDDISLMECDSLGNILEPVKGISITKENITVGKKMVLNNIYFETGQSTLLPDSYDELNKLYDYLNENKNYKINITGHTDNIGKEEDNQLLSTSRAKAVAGYLKEKGIDEKRISFKGVGSTEPIADNNTEEGKQQNRRVEFMIYE